MRRTRESYSLSRGNNGQLALAQLYSIALVIGLVAPASSAQRALDEAGVLEKRGNYEQALQKYQAYLKVSPSSSEARLGLMRNLVTLGQCKDAAGALKAFPRSAEPETEQLIGACYFRMHDFDQAIAHLKRAVELVQGNGAAVILLSRAYSSAGRNKDAIETLKGWLVKHPNDVDALYSIGTFYNALAEQTAEAMSATHPDHYLVYELQGDEMRLKQDYSNALAAYQKALSAAPDVLGRHFDIGDVYWRMLKFSEAREELEKELKINPYHPQANFELGDINVKEGNIQDGVPYLQRALRINPSLLDAHRTLGRALLAEKQYDEAVREFSIVAKAEPFDHTIHALLASTYRQMGRLKDAEVETQTYDKMMKDAEAQVERLKTEEQNTNDLRTQPGTPQ